MVYNYIVESDPLNAGFGLSSSVIIQVPADNISVSGALVVPEILMGRFLDVSELPLVVQNSVSASLGIIIPATLDASLSGSATPVFSLIFPALETTPGLSVADIVVVTVIATPAFSVFLGAPAPAIEIFLLPPTLSANLALSATPAFIIVPASLSIVPKLTTGEILQVRIIAPDPLKIDTALTASTLLSILPPSMDTACAMTALLAVDLIPAALQAIPGISITGPIMFVDRDYRITYECGLTEAIDDMAGLITFPISSFQARSRVTAEEGAQKTIRTFLSAVIPGLDNAEEISARAGDIIVWMVKTYKSGDIIREIIFRSILDNIRIDEGPGSQSITISGISNAIVEPKEIALSGASYYCLDKGKKRYRCRPEIFLRCGDTAQIRGDSLIVGDITWYCGVGQESLEIAEA
jgi:hypothetical protein